MKFNHSKLLGKMRECGYTQETLAKTIQMNKSTLNSKLKNKTHFTTTEMVKISEVFNIPVDKIGAYFFNQ